MWTQNRQKNRTEIRWRQAAWTACDQLNPSRWQHIPTMLEWWENTTDIKGVLKKALCTLTLTWEIWNKRNCRTFQHKELLLAKIKMEAKTWALAGTRRLGDQLTLQFAQTKGPELVQCSWLYSFCCILSLVYSMKLAVRRYVKKKTVDGSTHPGHVWACSIIPLALATGTHFTNRIFGCPLGHR